MINAQLYKARVLELAADLADFMLDRAQQIMPDHECDPERRMRVALVGDALKLITAKYGKITEEYVEQ